MSCVVVFASRDLTLNFIILKNCIQKVYDNTPIIEKCTILCGKLIFHEYNRENLDTTHDFAQIS